MPLQIPGVHEKGGKDRTYPASSGFVEFVQNTPDERWTDDVFRPVPWLALKGNRRAGAGHY